MVLNNVTKMSNCQVRLAWVGGSMGRGFELALKLLLVSISFE